MFEVNYFPGSIQSPKSEKGTKAKPIKNLKNKKLLTLEYQLQLEFLFKCVQNNLNQYLAFVEIDHQVRFVRQKLCTKYLIYKMFQVDLSDKSCVKKYLIYKMFQAYLQMGT